MFQLINELISKLDAIEDAFLIGLLEAKKVQSNNIKVNLHGPDVHSYTSWAKCEVKKVIPISYKVAKIEKLFDTTFDCQKCPLSIKKESEYGGRIYTYQSSNYDSNVCQSCRVKSEKLQYYQEDIKKDYEEKIKIIVANESIIEIIKMKSIIKNINRKLKKQ